jgi:hypothetical protein
MMACTLPKSSRLSADPAAAARCVAGGTQACGMFSLFRDVGWKRSLNHSIGTPLPNHGISTCIIHDAHHRNKALPDCSDASRAHMHTHALTSEGWALHGCSKPVYRRGSPGGADEQRVQQACQRARKLTWT